ncbi:MAG: monovalent cation/H+ antiporter complex subunit F [Rhodospirillales bacterium]
MMFAVAAAAVIVCMGLTLARAALGPTVFDRILAVNTFGTLTVILICVWNFLDGRPEFLDIALVYSLINFIGTVAVTRYIRDSHFSDPEDHDGKGDI